MEWKELKRRIQSIKPTDFEKFVAALLTSFFEIPFVVARSGDQPRGDARSISSDVSMQAKRYKGKKPPNAKTVEGDIRQVIRESPHVQVYVLAVSRDTEQLNYGLDAIARETGLDIVTLELSDDLSDLGALCLTYWEDIQRFFNLSDVDQEFSVWAQRASTDLKTKDKMKKLCPKLKEGIQTQKHIQKDVEKYLLERFSREKGFNPINLSEAIERKSLEAEINNWWEASASPVCYLEGEEGHGKSWLAAKWTRAICKNENVVAFWLDSKGWKGSKSIFHLLRTCFSSIYPSYDEPKIAKLQNKPAKFWRKTLIILDGVNERNAIETAQQILDEYFRNDESEWRDRVRFLLTTRPLDDYPDFESYLWGGCHKISVDPFNDSELEEALTRKGLQLDDVPNSLKKDVARIPRYFQRCLELRDELGSFDVVTKKMVLWADLLDKIDRTDPQIKQKFGWHRVKDAQEILSDLAKQAKWTNVDAAPQASVQLLKKYFPNYREVRHDLEEQRIALEAGPLHAKLSKDHIILGWALYLSNLFDCAEFPGIKDLAEGFQNALEPIPSEDRRTEALFLALQISAISPDPDISQDQLSQKRAALMLAWFKSHNAQITDARISFWVEEDPDAYAQIVEFEFEHNNSPNYEEALIAPLAKAWLNKKGDLNRLASRLKKWLLPTYTDDTPEDLVYTHVTGQRLPREKDDIQFHLLNAALSILSQRPERQFLEKLARCYENSEGKAQFKEDIGRLMRWGYTEAILDDLQLLVQQAEHDELLLKGIYGLAGNLCLVDLPLLLRHPISEKEIEARASVEQWNRRFKSYINRIRDQEKLLTGESPADNVKGNYHGLGYLAVRTDLPDLHSEDLVEIKGVLHYISMNAELGRGVGATREDYCIRSLIPWVARYDPESYAKLACDLKINALNQKWAQFKLRSIHGLIFKSGDCEKITQAILGMRQRLVQDVQMDNSSSDTIYLTSLLTETLLFSASEEQLTDWFEFLASHETLRESIFTSLQQVLLNKLLPESIVKLVQQKLETSQFSLLSNQVSSDIESEKITEEDFWSWLYLCIFDNDENTVTWAFENLKRRESDLRVMTYCFLDKATSDSNRFLSEIFTDKEVRKHLFLKEGRFFSPPIYEGDNSDSYEDLMSVLPQEVVGSFLCSPKRRADLSRWGKELMERMCLILQGDETNCNSVEELRFTVNREVLRTWATHNTTDFLRLANEYFTLLSKSGWYCRGLYDFMDTILCLLLRFQPNKAMKYYHRLKTEGVRTIYSTSYSVETFFDQLWQVKDCNSSEHHNLRRELLEECLNDEEIMFLTLAALAGGGEEELWNLVTQEYLVSPYAKKRNLGVSILPWFGTGEAIDLLEWRKSNDPSQWVREHAAWAYEVAQQERSCREVYREALQTRDLFRISAVFEQIEPALSPTARWWHYKIEHEEELYAESQEVDPKLLALVDRFWYHYGGGSLTKGNIEIFGRKLRDYCRGEKLSGGWTPRIAPWWKPTSDSYSS